MSLGRKKEGLGVVPTGGKCLEEGAQGMEKINYSLVPLCFEFHPKPHTELNLT